VLAAQMALPGFSHVSSRFASHIHSPKTLIAGQTGIMIERVHMVWKEGEVGRKETDPKEKHIATNGI